MCVVWRIIIWMYCSLSDVGGIHEQAYILTTHLPEDWVRQCAPLKKQFLVSSYFTTPLTPGQKEILKGIFLLTSKN